MAFAPGCDQQCAAQSPPQHSSVFSLGCRALTYPADHPTNLADALLGVGPAGSASRGDLARNDPQLALVEHVVDEAVVDRGLASQDVVAIDVGHRSEEHTSELQSLMRISYAVFCLKKK